MPGELSSGEKRHIGSITKAGNARVRYLLVEAAWRILASKQADTAALRAWAQRIMLRRGKRIAAVALARSWPAFSTPCGATSNLQRAQDPRAALTRIGTG